MLISIITPSFQQLEWLRLCVASVRDQVRRDATADLNTLAPGPWPASLFSVEHIIQDAGSPGIEDFAREVGADFYRDGELVFSPRPSSSDPPPYRIAIFCESDLGMYDAINRGLARANGEICAWLNSDEQYLEGTLAKVAKIFRASPDLDVLLGDALLLDSSLRPVCYRRIMVPNRWHTRLDHLHSLSCAMFFRPSALPSPPLESQWKVIGDAVLMDYLQGSGKKVRACEDLLSAYAFTGVNLSADPLNGERERWWNIKKWPPKIVKKPIVLHNRLRRLVHGAYKIHPVCVGLFTGKFSDAREVFEVKVSGQWPKPGSDVKGS